MLKLFLEYSVSRSFHSATLSGEGGTAGGGRLFATSDDSGLANGGGRLFATSDDSGLANGSGRGALSGGGGGGGGGGGSGNRRRLVVVHGDLTDKYFECLEVKPNQAAAISSSAALARLRRVCTETSSGGSANYGLSDGVGGVNVSVGGCCGSSSEGVALAAMTAAALAAADEERQQEQRWRRRRRSLNLGGVTGRKARN